MLTVYEELFLLTIDDEKGRVISSVNTRLQFGLAGAALAQLVLLNKVHVNEGHRLEIVDTTEVGDEILDEVLQEIKDSKPKKVTYWIKRLSEKPKNFRERVVDNLVNKGILSQDENLYLWIAPSLFSEQQDVPLKFEIKNRLRAMVLAYEDADLHNLALLSIARASRLLKVLFTSDERKAAERRIHEILIGEALGNPLAQTLEEIERAVSRVLADSAS